jgi:hypothetical protein
MAGDVWSMVGGLSAVTTAHVVEPRELAGPLPHDEDALLGHVDLQEVTGGEERFLPAGAEPLRGEDPLALSLERLLDG